MPLFAGMCQGLSLKICSKYFGIPDIFRTESGKPECKIFKSLLVAEP
jgi:hypothetical protein